MKTPIVDFVAEYAKSGTSRLHMPGHKGHALLGLESLDLTEINGADSLYEASGIIAQSQAHAAALFGTGHTFYSAEGSSLCIRAMLFLALSQNPRKTPVVVAPRNVHRAFLSACALLGIEVEWIYPENGGDSLCRCTVSSKTVEETIKQVIKKYGEEPLAVYITTPDYLGGQQPLKQIAAECNKAKVLLLVDHAHGAYVKFLPDQNGQTEHPMDCGAAMCCDSAHKTLPVLTGGAYLHLSPHLSKAYAKQAPNALALFGSTSPSYLILQSLDACNAVLAEDFSQKLAHCVKRTARLRERIAKQVEVLQETEPLKVVINCKTILGGGAAVAQRLREFGVECEYCDRDFLVLMTSPFNTEEDFLRVEQAFASPFLQAETVEPFPGIRPMERGMPLRTAMFAPQEEIAVTKALGRICASPLISCPPAIPIAVCGEILNESALRLFDYYNIKTVLAVT